MQNTYKVKLELPAKCWFPEGQVGIDGMLNSYLAMGNVISDVNMEVEPWIGVII